MVNLEDSGIKVGSTFNVKIVVVDVDEDGYLEWTLADDDSYDIYTCTLEEFLLMVDPNYKIKMLEKKRQDILEQINALTEEI